MLLRGDRDPYGGGPDDDEKDADQPGNAGTEVS
jgi:hypothetical protein